MRKIPLLCIMAAVGVIVLTVPAMAINQVICESKTVTAGAVGVPLHVKIDNDVALSAVIIPLEIRSTTGGAYITSLRLQFAERLTSYLTAVQVTQGYAAADGDVQERQTRRVRHGNMVRQSGAFGKRTPGGWPLGSAQFRRAGGSPTRV